LYLQAEKHDIFSNYNGLLEFNWSSQAVFLKKQNISAKSYPV